MFERVPGQWLGSWFLNICLAQSVVVAILVIGVGVSWPDPPMVAIATAAGVAAVVVPVVFFPWSRTLWLAIDLAMRPLDFDEGVAPGFELESDLERLHVEGDDGHSHGRAA
jgi:predicted metal-binding membrane protein